MRNQLGLFVAPRSGGCAARAPGQAWPKRKEKPETSETNPRVRVPTVKVGGRQTEASLAWPYDRETGKESCEA